MNGHPKMLPAQPGINAPRNEWIDINAIGSEDYGEAGMSRAATRTCSQSVVGAVKSVPYSSPFSRQPRKLTDDEFDDNQFSNENGDGEIY